MAIKMPVDTSCGNLLSNPYTFSGWLRKEPATKILGWRKTYCVISDRCFYYFKNETSKKAAGKFPLYGFNKVKRCLDKCVKWSFLLEHVHPNQKRYKFATSSHREMVEWMKHIKEEMLRANNLDPKITADGSSDGSSDSSLSRLEEVSLEKIEKHIYDDLKFCKLDDMPTWYNYDNSDSELDDVDSDRQQGEEPVQLRVPDIPKRKSLEVQSYRRTYGFEDLNQQLRVPDIPKRKSLEVQSHRRSYGFEDLKVHAGSTENIPQIPKEKDYWESIFFTGDKDEATKIIDDIAEDGVFLVRKSDDPAAPLALVVYSESLNKTRKFRIFKQMEDSVSKYYMKRNSSFDTLEKLLYHYYHNSISVDYPVKLKKPYFLA